MRISGLMIGLLLGCFAVGQVLADSCAPRGSVPEMPNNLSHGWLSPMDAASVRLFVQSYSRDISYWQGDTLITSCQVGYETIHETSAAEVNGGSTEIPFLQGHGSKYFTDLAARSGHTPQEGDVMARRYAQLGFFRYMDDGNGTEKSEAEIIYNRHARALGLGAPDLRSARTMDEGRAKALRAKIEAAKQRGDMNEMMRLGMEAQQMTMPVQQEVAAMSAKNDRLTWRLLEEAYPDLAAVSYQSRIVIYNPICLRCDAGPPEE